MVDRRSFNIRGLSQDILNKSRVSFGRWLCAGISGRDSLTNLIEKGNPHVWVVKWLRESMNDGKEREDEMLEGPERHG